ncbi:hypothetical protein C4577_07370 [Candidatus Parcubacteria bacterium]|nr:MAG: hypothetical protein C4577_07370 [Candidatus Parcubacteria bacterium]
MVMELKWIDKFPDEVGKYWFYGWQWSDEIKSKNPQLHLVEVSSHTDSNGHTTFSGSSKTEFFTAHAAVVPIGYWTKFIPPSLPDLSRFKNGK